ncbi:MAG: putative permease protein [Rhizobium sp.]|nr:putative permease protein [Rhizobium sp.]
MLIGGFGIGQGSIFLAQTYLVVTGRTELLAQFGIHFSFAMLGIIAVEAGSLTILSAQIARLLVSQGNERDLWRVYWETTVYRLTVAIVLIAGLVVFHSIVDLPDFSANYLIGMLPALLIWAFNGAGFLDGLQKSGISGITGSIAYVASAIGLVVSLNAIPATAGLLTGGALSIGYALTVFIQFSALGLLGWRPRCERPTSAGIRKAFIEETSMLAGLAPGQLYFRAQLAIASIFLGATATAMLVYAKQIVGAASQISGFARRIEFPRMVQAVAADPAIGIAPLVGIQKISFAIAAAMTGSIFVASLVIMSIFDGFTEQAWAFLAIFCVTILTEAVGQSLVQAMFARNLFHSAAVARIIAVIVAIGFAYVFARYAGSHVFILSDLVSHAIVISLSYFWLKRNLARHGHAPD